MRWTSQVSISAMNMAPCQKSTKDKKYVIIKFIQKIWLIVFNRPSATRDIYMISNLNLNGPKERVIIERGCALTGTCLSEEGNENYLSCCKRRTMSPYKERSESPIPGHMALTPYWRSITTRFVTKQGRIKATTIFGRAKMQSSLPFAHILPRASASRE